MPVYKINGISIDFPKEAYDVQIKYMEKVIESLNSSKNGLLESPTGTGKTLALLCSSLAWLKSKKHEKKNEKIKIIYLCRTHSQMDNVIKELKQTEYKPSIAIISSQIRYCLKYEDKNPRDFYFKSACLTSRNNDKCDYYQHFKTGNFDKIKFDEILDIEECVNTAKACQVCPYFFEREKIKDADLIIAPYAYILNGIVRKAIFDNTITLRDKILIFDEGHNVQQAIEEGASFVYRNKKFLDICLNELSIIKIMVELKFRTEALNRLLLQFPEKKTELMDYIFQLENIMELSKNHLENNHDHEKFIKEIDKKLLLSSKLLKSLSNYTEINNLIDSSSEKDISACDAFTRSIKRMQENIQNIFSLYPQNDKGNEFGYVEHGGYIMKVFEELPTFFELNRCFKKITSCVIPPKLDHLILTFEILNEYSSNFKSFKVLIYPFKDDPLIKFQCVDPSVEFSRIAQNKPKSIILTSGTLSPPDYFESDLGVKFDIRCHGEHVINPKKQILLSVISRSPTCKHFIFNHEGRQDPNVLDEMGILLINFCQNIPNGLLVCFASYDLMNKAIEYWEKVMIINGLSKLKAIFKEPQGDSKACSEIVNRYKEAARGKGGLLLGVCKGKIFEGVDFPDEEARGVVIIGIPYPYQYDPKFIAKDRFIKKKAKSLTVNQAETYEKWWKKEAIIGVQQAIGRVIRHKLDYGTIFLCDERYDKDEISLPEWAKQSLKKTSNISEIIQEIKKFFRENQSKT